MARVYPLELTTIRTPVPCNVYHAPRVRIINPCSSRCHCPRWLGWVRLGLILVSILRASASAMAMTVAVAIDGFGPKKREREKSNLFFSPFSVGPAASPVLEVPDNLVCRVR